MNLDISIRPATHAPGKANTLFEVGAEQDGQYYPIITVCQNGFWKHKLPKNAPFQRDSADGILATSNKKGE